MEKLYKHIHQPVLGQRIATIDTESISSFSLETQGSCKLMGLCALYLQLQKYNIDN